MKALQFGSVLLIFACHSENRDANSAYGPMSDNYEAAYDMPASRQMAATKAGPDTEEITKKVIKTGGIEFQSENVEEDYKKINSLLPRYKAYIENENQSKSSNRINYSLTVRVPATFYDSLYTGLSSFGIRMDHRYSNASDVTEQYYDLKTRIKNKEALEKRYLDLLEKTTTIKDILEVERSLNEVRTDIERLQGQFNYLSQQVSFSSISLSFYEVLPYAYDPTQRKGFGARILSALDSGWQGFLSFLVVLTRLWPFLLLIAGGIYLFRSIRRRRKSKK